MRILQDTLYCIRVTDFILSNGIHTCSAPDIASASAEAFIRLRDWCIITNEGIYFNSLKGEEQVRQPCLPHIISN